MRVAFFGQRGPFAAAALRHLLAASGQGGWELALVVEGGRPRAAHPWLAPAAGDGNDLTRLSARAAPAITCWRRADVNAAPFVAAVTALRLDAMICVGFDRLFSPALLAAVAGPRLNVHPSWLPAWRGPAPIFWALRRGLRRTGVSVHAMVEAADAGDIHAQVPWDLPACATGAELYAGAGALGGRLLPPLLAAAAAGRLRARPQPSVDASWAPRPRAADVAIDPPTWGCRALVAFAAGAPTWRTPRVMLGDQAYNIVGGVTAQLGMRLPGDYAWARSQLALPCRDGVAVVLAEPAAAEPPA